MMSRIYDNWEKLVGAVVRREKDRQLAYCKSFSSSSSADLSSRVRFEIPFAEVDHADLSRQNIFISRDVMAMEFEEIRKATRNFRPSNLLGGGLFSCVYKGWIDKHYAAVSPGSGIAVAVKVLNNTRNIRLNKWMDELNNLSQLRHPNLLTPIGYSFDTDQRVLIYEFMPKGSLDNHLFRSRQQLLPWATRIKVAVGAARALAFLHDLEIPVIYRILKSCNIILDGDFNPKLSGIGLAKDVSRHKIEGVISLIDEVALHGPYAAPEYIPTGMSTECDMYSFGVVLVELISGLQAHDRNRAAGKCDLIDWAIPYLGNESRLLGIIDRKLRGQYPHKEAYKVGQIALQCVSSDPISRPRMAEVFMSQAFYICFKVPIIKPLSSNSNSYQSIFVHISADNVVCRTTFSMLILF